MLRWVSELWMMDDNVAFLFSLYLASPPFYLCSCSLSSSFLALLLFPSSSLLLLLLMPIHPNIHYTYIPLPIRYTLLLLPMTEWIAPIGTKECSGATRFPWNEERFTSCKYCHVTYSSSFLSWLHYQLLFTFALFLMTFIHWFFDFLIQLTHTNIRMFTRTHARTNSYVLIGCDKNLISSC